jgi:hypothetical protein
MSSAGVPTANCIAFWEATLLEHRYLMCLSTGVIIQETINKLKLLEAKEKIKV